MLQVPRYNEIRVYQTWELVDQIYYLKSISLILELYLLPLKILLNLNFGYFEKKYVSEADRGSQSIGRKTKS